MKLMTPGPTEVPKEIRKSMSKPIQNPDIDEDFFEFYHDLEEKMKKIYRTEDDIIILAGEGMLGLEASIESTVEKGDEVLCLNNGIFGEGLSDIVEDCGGNTTVCNSPMDENLKIENIKALASKKEFDIATMVHCETPTGILNNIEPILSILKENDVLTLVDAVSSLGGVEVPIGNIDICMGASQKCFSAPPGLSILSISDQAWQKIEKTKQGPFYTNLKIWKETWLKNEKFPYTHSVSNLYGLNQAADIILKEGLDERITRHKKVSNICRKQGKKLGLETFPKHEENNSPTVTAFKTEKKATKIQKEVKEKEEILIATSLNDLKEKIIRIGHMGHNAREKKVKETLSAIEKFL